MQADTTIDAADYRHRSWQIPSRGWAPILESGPPQVVERIYNVVDTSAADDPAYLAGLALKEACGPTPISDADLQRIRAGLADLSIWCTPTPLFTAMLADFAPKYTPAQLVEAVAVHIRELVAPPQTE
jgi:hypothetical protein